MKDFFLRKIREKGGFRVHHAHLDKSHLITPERLIAAESSLQQKWKLYRELKINYTEFSVYQRMKKCIYDLLAQDVKYIKTFVDADSIVGLKCINAALKVKEEFKNEIDVDIAIQPLEGLDNKSSRDFFVKACHLATTIGGLPDRDVVPEDHVRFIFDLAEQIKKPVDIHVGQNNIPSEKETEMVLDIMEEMNIQQKVSLVHCISLNCQDEDYIRSQSKRMKNLNVDVIVCPSAAISMKQNHSVLAPVHNSIAPVHLLLEEGVNVKLGIDNIADLFMPLVDGDMWFECRLLMEAIRCYDLELISKLATS